MLVNFYLFLFSFFFMTSFTSTLFSSYSLIHSLTDQLIALKWTRENPLNLWISTSFHYYYSTTITWSVSRSSRKKCGRIHMKEISFIKKKRPSNGGEWTRWERRNWKRIYGAVVTRSQSHIKRRNAVNFGIIFKCFMSTWLEISF